MTEQATFIWAQVFNPRIVAIAVGVAILGNAGASLGADRQKHVLALYAVRRDSEIAVLGNRDLPRLLSAGLDESIDYYSEYLDAARFHLPQFEEAFTDFLRVKYQTKGLDVIIAMSGAVMDFVAKHRAAFFPDVPVVFFEGRSSTGAHIANSTGVFSEIKLAATLDLALALQPDLRHVFVVTTDGNIEATKSVALRQFRRFESRLTVTYLTGLSRDDFETSLAALPEHSMVFYFTMNRDAHGEFFHPLEYLDRISALANAPVYSWVDSTLEHGILGGVLKDQHAQIRELARMALRVLRGEPADSVPPAAVDINVAQLDWRQLTRWNINEVRVPAATVVRFRTPGLSDRYRRYLLAGAVILVGQSTLIVLLLRLRVRRNHAEAQARSAQAKLRASYERIRHLAGRLLIAQEAERARIARELHDDVGQQLAILAIDLDRFRAQGLIVNQESRALIEQTLNRARIMSKTLHDLSHFLHPGLLRHLGLALSLQRMIDEVPRDGLEIVFEYHDVPESLPQDVILCVFRIAQEALQNVVRHSAARHVSIHLDGGEFELMLNVQDDGVGFDYEAAPTGGLGLLSMAERLEAHGGSLNISSRPGRGTSLTVIVPFRRRDFTQSGPRPALSQRTA